MDHQFVPSCDNISNDIQNDSNENSVVLIDREEHSLPVVFPVYLALL